MINAQLISASNYLCVITLHCLNSLCQLDNITPEVSVSRFELSNQIQECRRNCILHNLSTHSMPV